MFTPGVNYSIYGDDVEQSPVWVRPDSLLKDRLDTWAQVVGYTVQDSLVLSGEVFFIDTLGTSGEYLIWEDGEFSVVEMGVGQTK